jgi:uncharacterized protein (TIGR00251 family)
MTNHTVFGIEETQSGVRMRVYVAPRSARDEVVGVHNGELKVALSAPPVEGAANRALVEYMAKRLGISKSAVRLVSGETSRHKTLNIEGVTAGTIMQKLDLK